MGRELHTPRVRPEGEHAAARHHLQHVDTSLGALGHRGADGLLAVDRPTEEVTVARRLGEGRSRRQDARFAGRAAVAGDEGAVADVAEIADRGHARGRLLAEGRRDQRVELGVGRGTGTFEAAGAGVGDQVDVAVEESGQERAVVRRHLAALGHVVPQRLDADDPLALDQDGGTVRPERLPVEAALRLQGVHGQPAALPRPDRQFCTVVRLGRLDS